MATKVETLRQYRITDVMVDLDMKVIGWVSKVGEPLDSPLKERRVEMTPITLADIDNGDDVFNVSAHIRETVEKL
jgi:hypothetical protein